MNVLMLDYSMLHKRPKLLDAGRIDYFVDYPFMIKYYEKVNKIKFKVVSVRMKKNALFYNFFVICNRTKNGKKVIAKVNQILKNNTNRKTFNAGWKMRLPDYL